MNEFIKGVAYGVINGVINIAVGSIIAALVYKIGVHNNERITKNLTNKIIMIFVSSFIGMVLPLNIYGLFPIIIALIAAGLPIAVIIPIVLSNSLFNMSMPYTDLYFVWQSSVFRIGTAFIAGVIGGLLLFRLKTPEQIISKKYSSALLSREQFAWSRLPSLINSNLMRAGIYLIIGIILNELFNKYLLWYLLDSMESNSVTAQIPMTLSGLNAMNPFFEQTKNIIFLFFNFITISGLFVFLRLRGVLMYFGFYLILGALFGISLFF